MKVTIFIIVFLAGGLLMGFVFSRFSSDNLPPAINKQAKEQVEGHDTTDTNISSDKAEINIIKKETYPNIHEKTEERSQKYSSDSSTTNSEPIWIPRDGAWQSTSPATTCADPFLLSMPVPFDLVTGVLWPGQVRGEYKGHGGFRFSDSNASSLEVRAPIRSYLTRASRYLSGGQVQYLLFFSVPCGYVYRFDHVRELSPKIATALTHLPKPTEGDSRTTELEEPLLLEENELVGTSVGVPPDNIFIDFGLYYVKEKNNVTPNPAWASQFSKDIEFAQYGVCIFDYFEASVAEQLKQLPAGVEGSGSDYCK